MEVWKKISFCLFLLISWGACSQDSPSGGGGEIGEGVSLTLSLVRPSLEAGTKALGDLEDDPAQYTDWEKAVDGRIIYRLTVFLVNSDNNIVAYRDIYNGSGDIRKGAPDGDNGFCEGGSVNTSLSHAAEAKVTFKYASPLHGNSEKLERGRYKLIAVANYSAWNPSGGENYGGLSSVTDAVTGIKTAFQPGTGLSMSNTHCSALMGATLDAGGDYICPQQPQPLTLVEYVDLKAGQNQIAVRLVRTYARVRITMENRSQTRKMEVTDLKFNDWSVQQTARIFVDPDRPDLRYEHISRPPSVSLVSADAIRSFSQAEIPPYDSSHPSASRKVVFDGYFLESKADPPQKYSYTLSFRFVKQENVSYEQGTQVTGDPGPDTDYLISNNNGGRCMSAAGNSLQVININGALSVDEVWQFKGSGPYTLYSPSRQQYVAKSGYNYTLSAAGIGFNLLKEGTNRWLQDLDNRYLRLTSSGISFSNSQSNWARIKIWIAEKVVTYEWFELITKTPDLLVLDASNRAVPLQEIRRNDFLQVQIGVNYNEHTGRFDFEVKPWNQVSNDIEVN